MLAQLLISTATYLLLVVPGIAAVYALDRRSNLTRVLALGNVVGLGAAILLGYYVLLAHLPLVCAPVIEYAGAAALVLWSRRVKEVPAREGSTGGHYLWIILLLVLISRAIPTFFAGYFPALSTANAPKANPAIKPVSKIPISSNRMPLLV